MKIERNFKYSINALRALIRETGKTPLQILDGGFDPTDLDFGIKLIWAGMVSDNRKLTPDMVGAMFDDAPEEYAPAVTEAIKAFIAAFERTFSAKVKDAPEDDGKN